MQIKLWEFQKHMSILKLLLSISFMGVRICNAVYAVDASRPLYPHFICKADYKQK